MYDHIDCETCSVIDFRTAWLYSSGFVYRVLQSMTVGYSGKKKKKKQALESLFAKIHRCLL